MMHLTPQSVPHPRTQQAHAALYRALLVDAPRRASLMTEHGEPKYKDAPKGHNFGAADLADHVSGVRTWATTLASKDNTARAGCRDYDAGGEAQITAALDAAHRAGVVAFAIVVEGSKNQHSGGHVWALYNQPAPVADIRAQLGSLPGAKGEVYPSGNCIRLPFGLHRTKHTRGILLLQDGRRFNLDDPTQLHTGIATVLGLAHNAAPAPAPQGSEHSTGAHFGASHAADWQHLPDGALLMASSRYRALFAARRQLTQLQRGERVVLPRDGDWDDSGSAQVAALVFNLITFRPKNKKAGEGAPPLAEIRAVALHWKTTLRDNRTIEHYQAHVDAEIARYRPLTYAPEATTGVAPAHRAALPAVLRPAQHRGRPEGQRAAHAERLANILFDLPVDADGIRRTTTARLANALGVTPRMVRLYLVDLREAGRLDTQTEARALAVLRVEIKSAAASDCQGGNCGIEQTAVCGIGTPESEDGKHNALWIGETPPPPAALVAEMPERGASVSPVAAPTVVAPMPTVSLAAAIAEAFDAYGAVRLTHKRIVQYLDANYPTLRYGPGALRGELEAERERRQRAKKLAGLANLKVPGLKAELRLAEYLHERSEAQQSNEARWWAFYAGAIKTELQGRPVESAKHKPRGMLEALPTPRQAAQIHHQQLLDLVEADRTRQPLPRRTAVAVRVDTPAQTQSAPDPFAQIKSLVASLKARLA